MKLIAFNPERQGTEYGTDKFVAIVTRDELAQIVGHPQHSYSGCPSFKVGTEVDVSTLFNKVRSAFNARKDLLDLQKAFTSISKTLSTALMSTSACVQSAKIEEETKS